MDIPFLKLMSQAYVSDSRQQLKLNEVESYLLESFSKFKTIYPEYASDLFRKNRSFQQDLIYSFLDNKFLVENEDDEFLEEGIRWELTKRWIRGLFKPANPMSPEREFMLNLVNKNYNNCNRKCQTIGNADIVNHPELLASLLYITPKLETDIRDKKFNNQSNININAISRCLRICYLDYLTSIYAEGIISYENCSQNLGGNSVTISTYSDILKNYPINGLCNDIYIALNDLFKEIDTMLNYIYLNDSFKKKQWTDIIFNKLSAIRKGQMYTIDFAKFDDEFEYYDNKVKVTLR